MAALLIGRVRMTPTSTETVTPIQNGWRVVASIMIFPSHVIKEDIPGPTKAAIIVPEIIVTIGVTIRSIFVSRDTAFPSSVLIMVAIKAPTGPPSLLPAKPTIVAEKSTKVWAFKAWAIAIPIAAPVISRQIGQTVLVKKGILSLSPMLFKIVPTKR